jgi:hypothetical protein
MAGSLPEWPGREVDSPRVDRTVAGNDAVICESRNEWEDEEFEFRS